MDIRRMTPADVELTLDWAAAEGWNPGRHDAASCLATDPDGLLVGLLDGEPAAVIACVRYADAFAFVGLYIVRADLRGHGHGIALWEAGHEHLGDLPSGLEAVEAQIVNYARSGYVAGGWTQRWQGQAVAGPAHPDVAPVAVADVLELDARAFGVPREAFLAGWLGQPEAVARGLWRRGRLVGYGVRRRCREGWKVGPLFAADLESAGRLLDGLIADLDGPYWIDIPRTHPHATRLATDRRMQPVFRTSRMVRGTAPPRDAALVYGVTSLELG
jgi:hypothetical protein